MENMKSGNLPGTEEPEEGIPGLECGEWEERYRLACARIREIAGEQEVAESYRDYFKRQAEFIVRVIEYAGLVERGELASLPLAELERWNRALYENLLPERYGMGYEDPSYAVKRFGMREGRLFSWLSARMYGLIFDAAEQRRDFMTLSMELFIEIYCRYEEPDGFEYRDAREAVRSFLSDNIGCFLARDLEENYDPGLTFAREILCLDTSTPDYLYRYGECITENERKISEYLSTLPNGQIEAMADTYVDGYLRGFETMRVRRKEHGTVKLSYPIGFERMMAAAVRRFEAEGLRVAAPRTPLLRRVGRGSGYLGTVLNPQFEYDHRQDKALYYDRQYAGRQLEEARRVFEAKKELFAAYLGPAAVETFGQPEFTPVNKREALRLDQRQRRTDVEFSSKLSEVSYRYIRGDETSYTIIAYPVPSIGEDFEEIFAETVRCNNLDNDEYQRLQQRMIDELDTGYACRIRGTNGNETDLTVMLVGLGDPEKETIFENCTADVNIPVGEVFTSPRLAGTNGLLHVSRVFLNGYEYKQLRIWFEDGRTTKMSCENFPNEQENREFLAETLLKHHPFLALGEFAIGTNTTAFVMGERFGIAAKLPILIAEKTGPHFALGDTCYKRSEDHKVYNRDGKEIIARENEISALRNTEPEKAYFNCHTDITIPYGEIGEIASLKKDGSRTLLMQNGRFVLPGTEALNVPLEEYEKEKRNAR